MDIWFSLAICLNCLVLAVFACLLVRRDWTKGGLGVSVLHLFVFTLSSVAPFRSLLDPDYQTLGIGLFTFESQSAVAPATVLVAWALAGVFVPLVRESGRWIGIVAVGDALYALNMAAAITVQGDWTFQLGEFLVVRGVCGLLVLWMLFTLPFVASAVWASSTIRLSGPPPSVATRTEQRRPGRSNGNSSEGPARFSTEATARAA